MADSPSIFSGKFNRQYRLLMEMTDGTTVNNVEVTNPITVEFSIERNNLASANNASFTVYNLGKDIREQVFKDPSDRRFETSLAIQFYAGYNDQTTNFMPRLFNGFMQQAGSYREGPNYRTVIDAFDYYSVTDSHVSMTMPPGTKLKDQIKSIAKNLSENIKSQIIGNNFQDAVKKSISVMGDPLEAINQLTGGKAYIDDQKLHALDDNEVVPGEVVAISSENGLLNTPKKYQNIVEIECLFEPRIRTSQVLQLTSDTAPRFNGVYKVVGISHRGVISGSVGGDCTTTLRMIYLNNYSIIYDDSTQIYRLTNG